MTKKVSDEQQAKLLSAKAVVKHKEKRIEEAIALPQIGTIAFQLSNIQLKKISSHSILQLSFSSSDRVFVR